MGIWSSIKKAAKKVWRGVKAVARIAVKSLLTGLCLILKLPDLLLGFIGWPPKKMRLHVVILPKYPVDTDAGKKAHAAFESEVQKNIDQVERIWRERMNVHLQPYGSKYIEFFEGHVPDRALNPSCCDLDHLGEEFLSSGEFYAQHTAGWVGIPISLVFPITVFVVFDVKCHRGCSNGPWADYVVISVDGIRSSGIRTSHTLMAHECAHACGLLGHLGGVTNLIEPSRDRGDNLNWLQRNIIRSSRHVTYL